MTQVKQRVIEHSPLEAARNMALAIIDLAKHRDLTPGQSGDRLHAIDMLAREVHDTIVDAEGQASKNDATLPAEDYICPSCGGKGWTANCADCIPY